MYFFSFVGQYFKIDFDVIALPMATLNVHKITLQTFRARFISGSRNFFTSGILQA